MKHFTQKGCKLQKSVGCSGSSPSSGAILRVFFVWRHATYFFVDFFCGSICENLAGACAPG